MNFNRKQRSYFATFVGFLLGGSLYELGYFLVKGRISLESTPFIITTAFVVAVIGIIMSKENSP